MSLGKWNITSTGELQYANKPLQQAPYIIYLEDHELFARAWKEILHDFFPEAIIKHIKNGDEALEQLNYDINEGKKINLIITDINHPGLRGDKFVYELRQIEKEKNIAGIPCIILTMVDRDYKPGLAPAGMFMANYYFTKNVEPDIIVEAIEELIY